MSEYDAVMWDFGGVFSASPFSALLELAQARQIDPAIFHEAIFGAYDEDGDHPWHRLERGEIDFGVARDGIMAEARKRGFEADPLELFAHMGKGGGVRGAVVEVAARVKDSGRRTAIVTNNAKEFRDHWVASVPVETICHEIVDSSEIGIRKPDPRIFLHALEKLGGVAAERAIFVDDYPANVAAAKALGMRGVLMEDDFDPALRELEALLGLERA
jgi:epoxide hydrolase-like predicted phosphatase